MMAPSGRRTERAIPHQTAVAALVFSWRALRVLLDIPGTGRQLFERLFCVWNSPTLLAPSSSSGRKNLPALETTALARTQIRNYPHSRRRTASLPPYRLSDSNELGP